MNFDSRRASGRSRTRETRWLRIGISAVVLGFQKLIGGVHRAEQRQVGHRFHNTPKEFPTGRGVYGLQQDTAGRWRSVNRGAVGHEMTVRHEQKCGEFRS